MSIFSSPSLRVFNSENSESMIQRKPGANLLPARKPFLDKTVNCNTPEVHKKQKSNLSIKEPIKITSPSLKTPSLEINPEDYFSYKEVEDHYEDMFSYSSCLETQHVYRILKNYLDDNTPPPSPTSVNIPFDLPDMAENSFESSFSSNKSYDDDMFFEMPKNNEFNIGPVAEIFNIDDL